MSEKDCRISNKSSSLTMLATKNLILVGDSMHLKEDLMLRILGRPNVKPPTNLVKDITVSKQQVSLTVWNAGALECFVKETAKYLRMFHMGIIVVDFASKQLLTQNKQLRQE